MDRPRKDSQCYEFGVKVSITAPRQVGGGVCPRKLVAETVYVPMTAMRQEDKIVIIRTCWSDPAADVWRGTGKIDTEQQNLKKSDAAN
jgi:hypothetical protein